MPLLALTFDDSVASRQVFDHFGRRVFACVTQHFSQIFALIVTDLKEQPPFADDCPFFLFYHSFSG